MELIPVSLLSSEGFLHTGATFQADLNLVAQLVMGMTLIGGAVLAKRNRYTAHGICQATVLLLNLVLIGMVMWPSFQQQGRPSLHRVFHKSYYTVAALHALLGITAEALGLYIVIVAGTKLVPQWVRFKNWKLWMRTELILWWFVVLTGVGTYYMWYIAPYRKR